MSRGQKFYLESHKDPSFFKNKYVASHADNTIPYKTEANSAYVVT